MSASLQPQTPRPEVKEFSNIRSTDGIKYMSPKTFNTMYLKNLVKMSSGTFEEVYSSGKKYAVKKFEKDYSLKELIKEVNIYASIVHPCILRPIAWTSIDGVGYLLMYKGIRIEEAFMNGKITIEEIIADSLSAIAYMNLMGYAHRDIKPGNMIYYKEKGETRGRCMIIDMGLATKATLGTSIEGRDGEYYIKDLAYTSVYMDPEYFYKQYNSIKVELYSLGMCYKQILTNKLPDFGDLFGYKTGLPHIDWIFDQITPALDKRASIQQILDRAPKALIPSSRRYTGIIFKENAITLNSYPKAEGFMRILMGWLVQVARTIDVSSETAFLCLHLIHRAFEKILIKYKGKTSIVQLFGCVCMSLATIVTGDVTFEVRESKHYSDNADTTYEAEYEAMVVNVLIALQGIITTVTYWNYAKSVTDLKLLLLDIMKINYNPNLIREVTSGPSKCVAFRQIMSFDEHQEVGNKVKTWVIPVELNESQIHPCEIKVDADITALEKYTKYTPDWSDVMEYRDYVSVLLHNRYVCEQLSLEDAMLIFKTLYSVNSKFIASYTLDALCSCDWRKWGSMIVKSKNIHPFSVTDEELILMNAVPKSRRKTIATSDVLLPKSRIAILESSSDVGLPPIVAKRGRGRPRKIIPLEEPVDMNLLPPKTKDKSTIQIEEKQSKSRKPKPIEVEESVELVEEKQYKPRKQKVIELEEPIVTITIPGKPTPYQEYLVERENPVEGNTSPVTPYRRKKTLAPQATTTHTSSSS